MEARERSRSPVLTQCVTELGEEAGFKERRGKDHTIGEIINTVAIQQAS